MMRNPQLKVRLRIGKGIKVELPLERDGEWKVEVLVVVTTIKTPDGRK